MTTPYLCDSSSISSSKDPIVLSSALMVSNNSTIQTARNRPLRTSVIPGNNGQKAYRQLSQPGIRLQWTNLAPSHSRQPLLRSTDISSALLALRFQTKRIHHRHLLRLLRRNLLACCFVFALISSVADCWALADVDLLQCRRRQMD